MATSVELRLELVKLTYAHGREASEAVERARALEQYVLAAEESVRAAPASGRGVPKSKKADKPVE